MLEHDLITSGLKVIKLEFIFKLKIKYQRLADGGHAYTSSQSLHFILSLRLYSGFITLRPVNDREILPFPEGLVFVEHSKFTAFH